MRELRALEAHLRAQPDDQACWLVYADALTERGDVRGELIVLKARLQTAMPLREREALQRRVDQLVLDHQDDWLQGWPARSCLAARWRHGFLLAVTLPPSADGVSLLEELTLKPAGRLLAEVTFSAGPIAAGAVETPTLGSGGAALLARSIALSALLRLELGHQQVGSEGAIALARSPHLGALVRLGLAHNGLDDRGARALARSRSLRSLVELQLDDNPIGPKGWAALQARWPSPGAFGR